MAIKKWHPLSELEAMRDEMERMWDELFPTPRRALFGAPWRRLGSEEGVSIPAVDVVEKDDEIVAKVEVPGVEKKDVDVSIDDGTLNIRAEVAEKKEEKQEHYIRRERTYRCFERSISVPQGLKADKIKAALKDGVLTVHLPKSEEKKARKIKVEVG